MLNEDFWLTQEGTYAMGQSEHYMFATEAMLLMPDGEASGRRWQNQGVPEDALQAGLERGADPRAVEFLRKGGDARLWAIREYGWIRAAKSKWNLWYFDEKTANLARKNTEYWDYQLRHYMNPKYEMVDVYEFKDGDKYSISCRKLLDGGNPQILKNLAMGRTVVADTEKMYSPEYSTAKYSETERRRLRNITGDNPTRRRVD